MRTSPIRAAGLEPRRHVDRVAHDIVAVGEHDHLTGVDTDPQADIGAEVTLQLERQRNEGLLHRGTGSHRPQRVVLTEDRNAEHGHQTIAGELDHVAVVGVDGIGEEPVHPIHDSAGRLGVEPFLESGRAGEIGEEDRHNLARCGRRYGG